ncbi:Pkinase Tyr domain containing protein [Asbolus verrucosus]|uniref:Pkinase Tyr domain containing protein n=1 Tax=Asbolus verrucosus TaxID=1661398 RepID=A0A482W5W4_ASBVE|nr:Pkinase Tyr domain containing protein [Asbolus verrucosus]
MRNCVIDKSFTVKISDHAMYCDRYESDYYISDTKARLPIRWMSWESLLLNDGCQRYLPRPAACPREIYDLMGECWKRNATDRPRFAEIHLFLQRKNLGYMPAPTQV